MPKRANATVSLISYYEHYGPSRYLKHLHSELGRLGVNADELRGTCDDALRDITSWLDDPMTEGARMLYDYRALDYSVLVERMHKTTNGRDIRGQLPKPRIAISLEITTKDNLAVRWQPGHLSLRYFPIAAPEWAWEPSSEYAIGARPETELMFVRGFGDLHLALEVPDRKAIAMLLVMAATSAVNALVRRLKSHFDVQMLNRIKLTFAPAAEAGVSANEYAKDAVPVAWGIVDEIAELHDRLKALIEAFPERHGVTAEAFWTLCDQCRFDLGHLDSTKASKRLRKDGKQHLTPKIVGNLFQDLETATEAGVWTSPNPKPTAPESPIIPFRRP